MPAPTTGIEFLEICRKSDIVKESVIAEYSDGVYSSPIQIAKALVRTRELTKFQAAQLLAGKYKGLRFDRLIILDRIGAGGMGAVFLCEHTGLRKKVAVKVLPPEQAQDESARERFFREARAAAVLDHPNIVRVHDMSSSNGLHYIVMEYVEGNDLQTVLNKYGPLPSAKACGYVAQVAQGLQHASERGLVHRDIKPGNLLVDNDGVVKILDMGLARLESDEKENLTAKFDRGAILGTADFMAPEQVISSSKVDIRADIYSLGITLYTLINGKPPFGGNSTQKIVGHQTQRATPLTKIRPGVPKGLSAIVDKMIAKNPDDRFQTPGEIVHALSPWMEADSVPMGSGVTRKLTATRRRQKPRRKRMPWATIAAVCVGVGMGTAGILWAMLPTKKPNSDQATQAPPSKAHQDQKRCTCQTGRAFG
jgi:eukaryotic-like serine/threonine-protein kinase